jgi:hypothetical protein
MFLSATRYVPYYRVSTARQSQFGLGLEAQRLRRWALVGGRRHGSGAGLHWCGWCLTAHSLGGHLSALASPQPQCLRADGCLLTRS